MLTTSFLNNYLASFFGYGQWTAPIWFVGIEEAGGRTESEVERRLSLWNQRGSKELEDAPVFYPKSGNDRWHGNKAELQATWKQLIRLLLLARNERDDKATMLANQREQLGSLAGDTCLAELLPLPSPDTETWNYRDWSDLPHLVSRQKYITRMLRPRADALQKKCAAIRPKVVIFYGLELAGGTSLLPSWSRIAGGWFDQAIAEEKILLSRRNAHTVFFVTRHPVNESDDYFSRIGKFLGENHSSLFAKRQ